MLILTIRTDNPESEIGLYDGQKQLDYEVWEAHRQLGTTIHAKIILLSLSSAVQVHTSPAPTGAALAVLTFFALL